MSWKQPQRLHIPWLSTLSRLLGGVAMPVIRGPCLWVVTDYSFDNAASDFEVIGLLLADAEHAGHWNDARREVRERLLSDGRSMSWKKLNSDSQRQAAFFPFLQAADHIPGLSITLAFHRHPDFQIPRDDLERFQDGFHLFADWKPRNLQQMFRIASCTAFLMAGLSNPGQDIHWVSDQDSAFANEAKEKDTISVFSQLLTMFLPHQIGQVRYGTTAHGVEPLLQEDLVAIPDLMCGATAELFTAIKREYTDIPDIFAMLPKLTNRPQQFLQWYASSDWPLKRYICTFEGREGRPSSAGILHPDLLGRSPVIVSGE
jgi:hypothetical protein